MESVSRSAFSCNSQATQCYDSGLRDEQDTATSKSQSIVGWQSCCKQPIEIASTGYQQISFAIPAPQHNQRAEAFPVAKGVTPAAHKRDYQSVAPLSRCLKFSSNSPAGLSQGDNSMSVAECTPARYGAASRMECGTVQHRKLNECNRQQRLQQWLANQEAMSMAAKRPSISNEVRVAAIDPVMKSLPPPAFLIMGLLG